jgi:hypothetical protein
VAMKQSFTDGHKSMTNDFLITVSQKYKGKMIIIFSLHDYWDEHTCISSGMMICDT